MKSEIVLSVVFVDGDLNVKLCKTVQFEFARASQQMELVYYCVVEFHLFHLLVGTFLNFYSSFDICSTFVMIQSAK